MGISECLSAYAVRYMKALAVTKSRLSRQSFSLDVVAPLTLFKGRLYAARKLAPSRIPLPTCKSSHIREVILGPLYPRALHSPDGRLYPHLYCAARPPN